ncbi:hypothetical protein [Spirosoma areae]
MISVAQRYSITSPMFEGQLMFYYNEQDVLEGFSNEAEMKPEQIKWLATHFPMTIADLEWVAGSSSTIIIRRTTQELTFDEFWEAYKLKVNKKEAQVAWDKLTEPERVQAFENIPGYNYFLMYRPNQNKMYPDTYLRGKFANDYKAMAAAK